MNMRKIIAVLAAVLMLCAIIPMGAISVSAASIFSANFDNGEVVFSVSADDTAVIEDGVLHWTTVGWKNLYKAFNGVAGTEYVLSVKAKASKAVDLKFVFHNGSWSGYVAPDFVPTLSTEWATYTYHFTPTEKGIVLLLQAKAAAEIWLDDIKVSEYIAPADPDVPDDAIYFENFEEDHTWASGNANASMEIIPAGDAPAAKAENGNYVVKHTIPENVYPYISDRTGISVQPNTDYIVSFDALNSSANWPIQLIIAENYWLGGAFALSLSQQIKPSATAWETYSFVFNTGDHDKIWLGAKSQWANTTVYFDNFYIAPLNGSVQSDGYLKNGNFEGGALEWLHTSNTEIVADPTGAGQGNVIKTNENTGSVHMFSQPATNLVAGHEYVLSFKVYGYTTAVSNAALFVKFPSSCSGFTFGGDLVGLVYSGTTTRYNVNGNLNKWMTATVTFTTSADVALIDFMNYRPNGGQYYFDDIVITPKHNWNAATCTAPKTCSVCGATEGEALGHTPGAAADCDSAQVCTVCGAELVAALGHSWVDATCTTPKTCSVCGATDGDALGHTPGAAADCVNAQTCTVCGEVLVAALGHSWDDATCDAPKTCSVCGATEGEALGHAYAESARVDATCGADGSVTYTCGTCGDSYTDVLPATGEHVYFDDCSAICEVCGYEREAGHNVIHVEAKDATCTELGNIEYWYCDVCGMAWLDEACTMNTNMMAVKLPMAEHTYFDDCSAICEVCGYEREAGHNVIHVEAKDATCTELGNIEYWYCDVCGMAWLDEACIMNTNMMAVKLPMAEHTYDNDFDADCNACGAIREVAAFPVPEIGKSISEDVNGYAVLFDANVEGLELVDGAADYTNATYNGYKLLGLGVTASNGNSETTIEGVRVYGINDETGALQFAFRIINIPESGYDTEITMVPYYIVEIDGVATTIEGEAVVGSYAEIAG